MLLLEVVAVARGVTNAVVHFEEKFLFLMSLAL